jgi:hypothetical protein
MGVAPACQRTRAYVTFAGLPLTVRQTRVTRMEFGLLPEFSTPVQKPVEIRVLRRTESKKRRNYGHAAQAKVRRARFEAILDVPPQFRTQSVVWA